MKYVIMRSTFGDIYIGKFDETKIDLPEEAKVFGDHRVVLTREIPTERIRIAVV